MLKLMKYINDRGGYAVVPALDEPVMKFTNLYGLFQDMLHQEQAVTFSVNSTLQECLTHNDHISYSFIQWYATEQVQEESVAKDILGRLAIIGDDKGGLYNFDKDIAAIRKV